MPDLWLDVDATLTEVPVNILALIDDTDFKTREESIAYDAAGMDLVWNFTTTGGATTQTAVTPTTGGGDYDWTNQGNGMYTIGIPASGGASINNDTEGVGWFTGYATGVLPWRGPTIGFRAAALNNALIDGGDNLDVNVVEISGDSTAADNAESFFDGTGYAGTNNVIPTVTDVTNEVSADVTAISGDATAADNLELACDNYSATRGLAGTALPAAAADAAGGLPISDIGGLDLDTFLGRITGNVALASVLGSLTDAAADGDPTNADTMMQYAKQLINILIGTTGVVTFPAEAGPGDGVSLAEVIRAIHADVTGLNGDAMRGTDSAALAATALTNATWTDARAGYLDELAAANMPADLDAVLADTNELQTDDVPGLIAALNDPTAAVIADAVWDEDIVAAHNGADTAGAILDDVATPANFMADVSNLDAAVSSRVPSTSLPTNFSSLSITAGTGYVDANIIQLYGDALGAETFAAMMNGPGSPWGGVPATVWGGTASSIQSSKVGDGNDFYNGCLLVMISGDYKGMARWIDDYTSVGGVFTLNRPLPGVPAAFSDYFVVVSPIDSRLALNALNANALDTDAVSEIADGILKRDWTSVTGEAARSVLNALRSLRNKVSVSGGILTVTKEDDSTSAWTAAVTTDAAADPITEVDPT